MDEETKELYKRAQYLIDRGYVQNQTIEQLVHKLKILEELEKEKGELDEEE